MEELKESSPFPSIFGEEHDNFVIKCLAELKQQEQSQESA